jgi:hypothetical protein
VVSLDTRRHAALKTVADGRKLKLLALKSLKADDHTSAAINETKRNQGVNLGRIRSSTRGPPWVNLGSTRGQLWVNTGSTWGQPGVNLG